MIIWIAIMVLVVESKELVRIPSDGNVYGSSVQTKTPYPLEISELTNFTINFTRFWLEDSYTCKMDQFNITNIKDTFIKLAPRCGINPEPRVFHTLDYGLIFGFSTDASFEYDGIEMEIYDNMPDSKQVCDMMFDRTLGRIASNISDFFDRYPSFLDCHWDIDVPQGVSLLIHFEEFNIEFSGPDCPADKLEIWERDEDGSGNYSLRRKLCGRYNPWTFSAANDVRLTFFSDNAYSKQLFRINYSLANESTRNELAIKEVKVSPWYNDTDVSADDSPQLFGFKTKPGFKVELVIYLSDTALDLFDSEVLIAYDGPSEEYETLTPSDLSANSLKMISSGFYLTLKTNASLGDNFSANIRYRALVCVTPEKSNFIIKGDQESFFVRDSGSKYIQYFTFVVTEGKYPRVSINSADKFFEINPNINNCEKTGMVLYQGELRYENIIGPFCDETPNYVRYILRTILGSSSVLNAVLYNYANMSIDRNRKLFELTASNCKGYQLTDEMFQSGISAETELFHLIANKDGMKHVVELITEATSKDCYVILLLPDKSKIIQYELRLSSYHRYTVCTRWETARNLSYAKKLEELENCTAIVSPSFGETFTYSLGPTRDEWSVEYYWIEIGPVEFLQCQDVPSSCGIDELKYLPWDCGVIRVDNPSCTWKLPSYSEEEMIWQLDLNGLNSKEAYMDAVVTLKETSDYWNEKTRINYHRIGERRTFRYKTMWDVQVDISTENVFQIVLSFERLPRVYLQNYSQSSGRSAPCLLFNDHCYFLREYVTPVSWEDASVRCELVSINTLNELNFLKMAIMDVWYRQIRNKSSNLMFIGLNDLEKAGDYIWEDQSPLTVSDWYYPFAPFDHVLSADNSRVNASKIQPAANGSERCAAMVPRNTHFSLNWVKISCTDKLVEKTYSICEQNRGNIAQNDVSLSQNVFGNLTESACTDGWNYVIDRCLAVLTQDAPPGSLFSVQDADALCRGHGGKIASIDQFHSSTLKSFLISLNMAKTLAGFWYNLSTEVSGCLFMQMLQSETSFKHQLNLMENTCNSIFGQPSHVICESDPEVIPYACQKYQFMCDDNTCLTPDLVCDGFPDCAGGEDENNCTLSMMYECRGGDISLFKYCDFRLDCKFKEDERTCVHRNCSDSEWQCGNKECIPKERRCDHKPECADGSDEKHCDWGMECKSFRCTLVGCLPNSKVEDLHPDCPDSTEADETVQLAKKIFPAFYRQNGVLHKTDEVLNECPGYVDRQRCHIDHSRCYPRHRNCIFDQDVYGSLTNCRNGVHLNHCEDFECPGLFKCKRSYCIPLHKICDGKNDCADGEDETKCEDFTCPHQLRCGKSRQCVSQENVCDGQIHCKSGYSDELYCDLIDWSCPDDCSCFGYTMSCPDLELDTIPTVKFQSNLRILNFTLNHLDISNTTLRGFQSLAYLYLSQNLIKALQRHTFVHSPNMLYLDLNDNLLETIVEGTFQGLVNLKTLLLLRNRIRVIADGSFEGLRQIKSLNLSGMGIQSLSTHAFDGLKRVEELDLSYNEIAAIEPGTFSSEKLTSLNTLMLTGNSLDSTGHETFGTIRVKYLQTSSYRFCCFVKSVTECEPENDTYSSCSALLANDFLRAIVWFLGLTAVIANGAVIIWRIYDKVPNVPSIFVLNLAISDMMMGIFLLSIVLADVHYRGNYILKDMEWRRSVYCNIIGIIATVAVEMSMFTLVVIAVDRTKRLAFPFSGGQISKRNAWTIEIIGWLTFLLLSLIPLTLPSYFGMFYGRNSICVPFNLSDVKGMGWEYATAMFVVFNSCALGVMIALYIVIYFRVKETVEASGRKDKADLDLARNLSMVITSNIFGITPIIIANVSSVVGNPVSREMASLLTAVILPLNAVLNPCIFILSTVRAIRVARQRAKELKLTPQTPKGTTKPT